MEKKEKLNPSAFKSHNSALEKQKNSNLEGIKPNNETKHSVKTTTNAEGKDLQKIRDLILAKKSTSSYNEKANQSKKPLI